MTSFDAALRRLAEEFDLPEPIRSRALLELRSDLEDMAAVLESRGVEPEEAGRRALEALLPTGATVAEWRAVHRPLYQRLVDRFSVRGRHRLERLLLAVLAAIYVVGGLAMLSTFDLLADPSGFLWPVLALSGLIVLVGGGVLFQLFVAGARGKALRRTLGLQLGLGAATLGLGFAGVATDLYGLAGRIRVDPTHQVDELLAWLRRDTALFSVALLAASVAGLVWLVAAIRVAGTEQAEAAALGFSQPRKGKTQ